jgi:Protein of unknown function (DUF3298)/Deacetylase PdaC
MSLPPSFVTAKGARVARRLAKKIMKLRRELFIWLALSVLLGAGSGCRKESPSQRAAPSPAAEAERQHPEGGVVASAETRFFKGSIGSTLGLQMKLVREGDNLTGSYFYQKIGKKIDVRGSLDKNGNFSLIEFDAAGKQTGVFKGTWKQTADGAIEIAGNWTRPDGDKKAVFSLQQEPIEFSHGVEIIARQIKEKNKRLKYEVDVEYPQLTGSVDQNFEKFNQAARSLATKMVGDFKKMMTTVAADAADADLPDEYLGSDIGMSYEVMLAKDDLISIEFAVSSYSGGAAHPNSYTEVLNFDLKNGRTLKLADLFQPGAKYVQALSRYSIDALKPQAKGEDAMLDDDWIKKGAGADLTNFDNWTITKKGLGITFDPYQVGPYAAGPQHVLAPYTSLKDIIKPDGPVAQFAR